MDDSKSVVKACVVGLVVVAALVLGFGFLFKSGDVVSTRQAAQPNPWTEQQRLMRDAMDVARESQRLAREHMEMQRREMEMYEEAHSFQVETADGEDW
jgi:hypothetical protein